MSKVRKMIDAFKTDIHNYIALEKRTNFHLCEEFDAYEDEYFLSHNDKKLDLDEKFQEFVYEKDRKYFDLNGIYNVCFAYDFILVDKVGLAKDAQPKI